VEIAGVVRADVYYLDVSAKGYGPMSRQLAMPPQPTNRLEFPTLVLEIRNQKLGGQILDADGKPFTRVNVNAVAFSNQFQLSAYQPDAWDARQVLGQSQGSVQTDSQGRFFFGEVCEGPIQLNLSVQGSSVSAQTIGGNTNIVLRLNLRDADVRNVRKVNVPMAAANPGVRITGTVRNPSGAPAGGVSLSMYGDYVNLEEVKTDAAGRYSLNWRKQASAPQLVIFARDLEHNLAASHEIDGTITNVDLNLQPGLTLSVKVQDTNGRPIPSAWETLAFMNLSLNQNRALADGQGLIEITALPKGLAYSAIINSRGFSVARVRVPAEQTRTTHIELPAAVLLVADRRLAGTVLDPDGEPFPTANVDMSGDGQVSARAITDAGGHFVFDGVCEGAVRLTAFGGGGTAGNSLTAQAQAQGGDTNIVVKLGVTNGAPAALPSFNGQLPTNRPPPAPLQP
jgi:hypothetical protein